MSPFDLAHHMPLGPTDGVREDGYTLKAWQPADDGASRAVIVQAYREDRLEHEVEVTLDHPNDFGIDAEDMSRVEAATEHLLAELRNP